METTFDSLDGNQQLVADALATRDLDQAAEVAGVVPFDDEEDDTSSVVIRFEYRSYFWQCSA